jgi:hypothetical protein
MRRILILILLLADAISIIDGQKTAIEVSVGNKLKECFNIQPAQSDQTSNGSKSSSIQAGEEYLFVSTLDGQLVSVDPLNGQTKWALQEGAIQLH